MAKSTDLIKRLEEAEGADRELDKQLWLRFVPGVTRQITHVDHWRKPYDIDETRDADGVLIIVPSYTASIDAALSLVWEVLPEATWLIGNEKSLAEAELFNNGNLFKGKRERMRGEHKSPAIALLIALLKAHAVEVE